MNERDLIRFYQDFLYALDHWREASIMDRYSEDTLGWEALLIKRCKKGVNEHLIPPWFSVPYQFNGATLERFYSPDSEVYWKRLDEWLSETLKLI